LSIHLDSERERFTVVVEGIMKCKGMARIGLAITLLVGSAAWAGTILYVNGLGGIDSNDCKSATTACKTIGHAISLAASGDTIKVDAATYTENLNIGINLKILGSGAPTTIIDGGGVTRVVAIASASAHVTLSGLTIRHGLGGVFNNGILRLFNTTVSGNTDAVGCYEYCIARGGGIDNLGTVTITNSTVSANLVDAWCKDHCNAQGGGIFNQGKLTITNSTLSGNTANAVRSGSNWGLGGGIFNLGTMTINNSTISQNTAHIFSSGGIANVGSSALQNTIIANNAGNCDSPGPLTSNGYNLSSDSTCAFSGTGDMNNTDPMLGPLQYNGGPTQTMALPSGSPAIDAGNPAGCTDGLGHLLKTDQRGMPRPDPEDTGGCDMGAYESQSD
jgi:hypothetical protein